jgi:hypothetical protein
MRRLIVLAALLVGACGDNTDGATGDAGVHDAPVDADPQALAPCLDTPTQLARPPEGVLPCDLLPPDFAANRRR